MPVHIPIYQVDAFTDSLFGGNPAAVCPLEAWLPETTMQAIVDQMVDEYLDRIRTARAGSTGGPQPATATAGPPRPSAAEERTARKELQRLERQLDRLSVREAELTELLAANATDYEKLTSLGAELRAVQGEKSELEERWLAVAAELDA